MKHQVLGLCACFCALALGCASPAAVESEKLDPELQQYVLPEVPADVRNPTLVDFGGKVHLVGWELSPKGTAAPKSTLNLKLYWRSVKKVGPGFHLYTHLTGSDGKIYAFDDVGPLRQGEQPRLPPSAWTPGMIYVDEQSITVPNVEARTVTLSVGVKREVPAPEAREGEKAITEYKLEILSGVSDGRSGALIARMSTGVRGGDKAKDKELRRRLGQKMGADRRPPGSASARGALGRAPGSDLDKEIAQ